MNYQPYAGFRNYPAYYGEPVQQKMDKGNGIEQLNANNTTVSDIYMTPFLFIQDHRKNYNNMADTALKGIQCTSDLSKMFFADENIKRIQRMLKDEVFRRSNGEFKLETDQEQRDILLGMRSVFLQEARHLPGQTVRQVKRLNQKVVDETVPGMLTELRQYYGYLREINKPLTMISLPQNTSGRGRMVLPSVMTTLL